MSAPYRWPTRADVPGLVTRYLHEVRRQATRQDGAKVVRYVCGAGHRDLGLVAACMCEDRRAHGFDDWWPTPPPSG